MVFYVCVCVQKARDYKERIMGYTHQFSTHVRNSALRTVASCTPVWDLFDSARGVACKGIIEPLVSVERKSLF